MTSCAFGTCDRSKSRGGPGCDLCDRVARLPQPKLKSGAELEVQAETDMPKKRRRRDADS